MLTKADWVSTMARLLHRVAVGTVAMATPFHVVLTEKKHDDQNSATAQVAYKSVNYRGVPCPAFNETKVVETVIDDIRRRHSLEHSAPIVIATYPKCGTTWMQQIVLTLLAGGDGSKVRDPMKVMPDPFVCRRKSIRFHGCLADEPLGRGILQHG